MLRTLEAFEFLPVNLGLQPSARTGVPGQLEVAIEAGAVGLKIHEDWGAYPEGSTRCSASRTRTTSRSACTRTG